MQSRGNNAHSSSSKRAVSFGDNVLCRIHEVESFRDVANIWWTKDEISDIERESDAIIYFMNSTAGTNDSASVHLDMHSIRGLEKKTEIGAWEMYETQRDARNAVLCLQDKQQKLHRRPIASIGDQSNSLESKMQNALAAQEAIAKVYQAASLKARRDAYEIGLRDFLETKQDDKPMNGPRSPMVPTQKANKVIPITSEPMIPKWGRKISMPLMDPSDNSESSSLSAVTKEVQPIIDPKSSRTGVAPKIRSSLSPLKTRRLKPSASEEASECSRDTQIESTKPRRSSSFRRKSSSPERKAKRSSSLHRKLSSEKAAMDSESTNTGNRSISPTCVTKAEIDKPTRRRTASPGRKTPLADQAELATAAPRSSKSRTRAKISSRLSGDILKLQKALADFESSSLSCDENVSLRSDKEPGSVQVKRSSQNAPKKSLEKQVLSTDIPSESHRIRVVVKKKQRNPSNDSSFRYCPSRSASHGSKGNQTADTAALFDLSNSSIESFVTEYIENKDYKAVTIDTRYSQNNSLGSPTPSSDSEVGGSGTILSNLLKRIGGDRKNKAKNKGQFVEA